MGATSVVPQVRVVHHGRPQEKAFVDLIGPSEQHMLLTPQQAIDVGAQLIQSAFDATMAEAGAPGGAAVKISVAGREN